MSLEGTDYMKERYTEAVRLKVFNEAGQIWLGYGRVTGSPTNCLCYFPLHFPHSPPPCPLQWCVQSSPSFLTLRCLFTLSLQLPTSSVISSQSIESSKMVTVQLGDKPHSIKSKEPLLTLSFWIFPSHSANFILSDLDSAILHLIQVLGR